MLRKSNGLVNSRDRFDLAKAYQPPINRMEHCSEIREERRAILEILARLSSNCVHYKVSHLHRRVSSSLR
ncbi:MAG: hypothetical protein ACREFK_20780, partial [Stellaceae bacterium]